MSAETLRKAANLMRERAEDAAAAWGRDAWQFTDLGYSSEHGMTYDVKDVHGARIAETPCEELAEHVASWHPAVALAVAKAMEDVAVAWENCDGWTVDFDEDPIRFEDTVDGGWLAVARTYLGESA